MRSWVETPPKDPDAIYIAANGKLLKNQGSIIQMLEYTRRPVSQSYTERYLW